MRLADFCNRRSTRAPASAVRFLLALGGWLGLATSPPTSVRVSAAPGQGLRLCQSWRMPTGGGWLDGEPPASAMRQPLRRTFVALAAKVPLNRAGVVQAEPRSKAPPRPASRAQRSQPRSEHAASPLAPLSRPPRRTQPLGRAHVDGRQVPPSPPSRQRQRWGRDQDAFPRQVLSPPHRLALCAWLAPNA